MILVGFLQNLFPVKGSLVKMPNNNQKKKNGERKAKEEGRRDSESER